MTNKAVYFPYIRVPDNPWFTRAVLYWDEVAAIVPSEYIRNPGELGPFMVELVRAGLVKQLFPREFVHEIPHFSRSFLDYIDSHPSQDPPERSKWMRIHMEKLGRLPNGLIRRGLAHEDDYPWFRVERDTANKFMAYLAGTIGQMHDDPYVPISDEMSNLTVFADDQGREAFTRSVEASVLENTLPAPVSVDDPQELAAFKEKHRELLRRFRRRVEIASADIAVLQDEDARAARLVAVTAEMNDDIEEITARLREKLWPHIVFGTFCSLPAAAISAVQAAMQNNAAAATSATLSLISAVFGAFAGSRTTRQSMNRPFAYAALARERLGRR